MTRAILGLLLVILASAMPAQSRPVWEGQLHLAHSGSNLAAAPLGWYGGQSPPDNYGPGWCAVNFPYLGSEWFMLPMVKIDGCYFRLGIPPLPPGTLVRAYAFVLPFTHHRQTLMSNVLWFSS